MEEHMEYYDAEEAEREIREAFQVFDRGNQGFISAAELLEVMRPYQARLTENEVNEMFRLVDQDDGNEEVDYQSFVDLMMLAPSLEQSSTDVDEPSTDIDVYAHNQRATLYKTFVEALQKLEGWSHDRVNYLQYMLDPFELRDQALHLWIVHQDEVERLKLPKSTDVFFNEPISNLGDEVADTMINHEFWCPSTVKFLRDTVGVAGLHYAQIRFKKSAPIDHSKCTAFQCAALTVDTSNYKQSHAHFCETMSDPCRQISVDIERVASIIARGNIPQVVVPEWRELIGTDYWRGSELEIVESTDENRFPFCAISHVWAHGMGSPSEPELANTLPSCRWSQVQMAATKMEDSSFRRNSQRRFGGARPPDTKVNVWIDTLCVPTATKYKDIRKLAIAGLSKVYRQAEYILVHDDQIRQIRDDVHKTDIAMAILSSDWMRRLWTLEESMLASTSGRYNRLNIQLDARNLALDNVVWSNKNVMPSYGHDAMNALLQCLTIVTTSTGPTGLQGWTRRWANIAKGIEYRSITRDLDESICIGAALDIDISEIVALDTANDRMARTLRLAMLMPASILFCDGERLLTPPCSWGPTTFLTIDGLSRYEILAKGGPEDAWFENDGLHSQYHSIRLTSIGTGNERSALLLKDISSFDMHGPIIDWDKILAALQADYYISRYFKNPINLLDAFEEQRKKLEPMLPYAAIPQEWLIQCYVQLYKAYNLGSYGSTKDKQRLEDKLLEDATAFARTIGSPYSNTPAEGENIGSWYEVVGTQWEADHPKDGVGWTYHGSKLAEHTQLAIIFNHYLPGTQAVILSIQEEKGHELHARFLCQVQLERMVPDSSEQDILTMPRNDEVTSWESMGKRYWCIT